MNRQEVDYDLDYKKMEGKDLIRVIRDLHHQLDELLIVLENINDGIYLTDGKANTMFLNKSYEKISSTPRERFIGKNMYQVVEEKLIDQSGTILALEQKREINMRQILNNGRTALITSTPIYGVDGEIILVVTVVRDITELTRLKEEVTQLKKTMEAKRKVVYQGNTMENILMEAGRVAKYDSTVLITGETGVGKDVISRFIWENSTRSDQVFSHINCSSIPETLIESEFFGYEKGAFTGADKAGKHGIFEKAAGGTVFLDEIGELPLNMQASLLTVLQDKKVRRVGGTNNIDVDVRIIAATNRDLRKMVEERKFREDLYYRLNVISIEIPPLRERREDIFALIQYFVEKLNLHYNMNKRLNEAAMEVLYHYDWPGNVRELQNLIERVFVLSANDVICVEDLPVVIQANKGQSFINDDFLTLEQARDKVESVLIEKTFKKFQNVTDAARQLGIDPSTFVRKRKKYLKKGLLSQDAIKKD